MSEPAAATLDAPDPPRTDPATPEPVLRDVPGPSALGGGARRFWELLTVIAVTDSGIEWCDPALVD